MRRAILPSIFFSGFLAALAAPASAVTSTATVNVTVVAATEATIGVSYSSGSSISCAVTGAVTGSIACTNTATLSGNIRTTVADSGGASVSLTGAAIAGTGSNSIAPSALQMTCSGGTTAGAMYLGTPGTLASNTPLSTSAVTCLGWSGTIVDSYNLIVSLAIDASKVPADTYGTAGFTATATAN